MPKFDIYEMVTNKFIEALKSNIIPWQKPWSATDEIAINRVSGKPYRGVNVWLLGMVQMIRNYEYSEWLTYKQAAALGGQVRKGEKATEVIFWKKVDYKKKDEVSGEDKAHRGMMLRYYSVFNIAQCDGIQHRRAKSDAVRAPFQVIDAAQELVDGWSGPNLRHGGAIAAYSPELDQVYMPKKTSFETPHHYYHTLFHEYVHSTGHKTRLDRELTGGRMTDRYAKEELIAEMGAAMLSTSCGIDVPAIWENSVGYVQHWIAKLESDPKLILQAAGASQKAVDMIVGTQFEDEEVSESSSETVDKVLCAA